MSGKNPPLYCVCVVVPFILDVRLFVDIPAGVTQNWSTVVIIFTCYGTYSTSTVKRLLEYCSSNNTWLPFHVQYLKSQGQYT